MSILFLWSSIDHSNGYSVFIPTLAIRFDNSFESFPTSLSSLGISRINRITNSISECISNRCFSLFNININSLVGWFSNRRLTIKKSILGIAVHIFSFVNILALVAMHGFYLRQLIMKQLLCCIHIVSTGQHFC